MQCSNKKLAEHTQSSRNHILSVVSEAEAMQLAEMTSTNQLNYQLLLTINHLNEEIAQLFQKSKLYKTCLVRYEEVRFAWE